MSETSLAGKTAVILGASSPCGKATARLLADQGVNLALGGRSRDELEALQGEIEASGGRALVVGTHLAKRHHPVHLVEAALEEYGGLDILLFMARASAPPLDSLDLEAWERSIDVNFRGFMYCLATSLPALRESESAHVIYFSGGPETPDPLYEASEAAVGVLLRQLRHELAGRCVYATFVEERKPELCAKAVLVALRHAGDKIGKGH
ncbi:hypothetical protein BH23ACT11_BH23ACT11_04870 [soil metagenome]